MRSLVQQSLRTIMLVLGMLFLTVLTVAQSEFSEKLGAEKETTASKLAHFPHCPIAAVPARCPLPKDCLDVQNLGYTRSGVYTVYVGPLNKPIDVFCDKGWLVFQRRQNGFTNFYRNWNEYANGFGDLYGEFWLGNEYINLISQQANYGMKISLETFEGETEFAEYTHFKVAASYEKYKLTISGFTSGSPPGDSLSNANGAMFSTYDRDNDIHPSVNCAVQFSGAWWYVRCHASNLNGKYLAGSHSTYADGINWNGWKGFQYSMKATAMMMRPV